MSDNMNSSEFPQELRDELLDYANQIAENYRIKLDFSHRSIKLVEKILAKVHKDYRKSQNEEGLSGIALEFATYIVAVIERNGEKGRWERNHPDFGEDSFPFYWKDTTLFPYAWCLKRIFDGKGDDVWAKYKTMVLQELKDA